MKTAIFVAILMLLSSCMTTRSLTESYIKNNIQQHLVKQEDEIRITPIYKSEGVSGRSYVEFTGYKYKGVKGLVIGGDKYYISPSNMRAQPVIEGRFQYVVLTEEEARAMLSEITSLRAKAKVARTKSPEVAYEDYTVNDDLFISFKGSLSLNLWMGTEGMRTKYEMSSYSTIERKLRKFLNY